MFIRSFRAMVLVALVAFIVAALSPRAAHADNRLSAAAPPGWQMLPAAALRAAASTAPSFMLLD